MADFFIILWAHDYSPAVLA